MALFTYVAYNTSGVEQKGRIDAIDLASAKARLEHQQLLVADIKEASSGLNANVFGERGLTIKDVEFFTAEISLLLTSGLRVDKGLQILLHNVEKPALRDMLQNVLQQLKQGHKLSESIAAFPVFSSLYIGLVQIAEETGELAATFQRLADELHYQMDLREKIKQALVYPAVILTVCVAAIVFIFNFVVPNLTSLFQDQQNLPGYTVALLAVSDFFNNYQLWLALGLVATGVGLWYYREHSFVKALGSKCRERLPVVANANLLVERIRFNAALHVMLSAGVAIDRSMKLAAKTLRTESLRNEVARAAERVNRGEGLADCLSESRLYPPYFAALLSIGEESGELARVFGEIADRSRRTFYSWVTRFTSLLEPALILFMGAVVGTIVVIMMLSISAVTDMPI
ncbi:Type II secretion system protein F [Pseudidiomarina piscicola]|uniref:Type II secretion system protein F n=1 Tax=Pseudidiomarina piscicola TaxID=2614830 RepID=A0A6S6WQB4_9GAMM|nr:type II secretion system F family protein [Pseudidiomarina piscicola]CAB0151168.1 Type II secretion system protein F [Pseudidiomarina piscicola]VZT40674.1 Type II secretion system protein F [Pseudomonas aeruginosa]